MDEYYGRPEPESQDVTIRGMQLASPDYALICHTRPAFDRLCAYLSREVL